MTLLLRKSLLRVSLALAGLAAVAVSTRFVLWQGLLGPIRVVSGSMAETLLGEHYRLVCADCGRVFHCGRESPPPAMQAVCPNCGYSQNAAAAELLQAGQRVLIDQFVPAAGPRRWEMVAFTSPDGASELTVKRVVGLPGETLEIRGGDIYIDGRIAR
jgi:signal peptidase I